MSRAAELIESIINEVSMDRVLPELDRLAAKYKGHRSHSKPIKQIPGLPDFEMSYSFPSAPLAATFQDVAKKQLNRAGLKTYGADVDVAVYNQHSAVQIVFYDAE